MWERKIKERRKKKEKNENEEERKVLSEGKIRFQKQEEVKFLCFYCLTAFQTKVFQRWCCSNTAQHVSSIKQRFQKKLRRIRRREKVFVKPNYWKETLLKYSYYNTTLRERNNREFCCYLRRRQSQEEEEEEDWRKPH